MPSSTEPLGDLAAAVRSRLEGLDPDAARVLEAGLLGADPYPATCRALDAGAGPGAVAVAVGKCAAPMARAWQDRGGPPGIAVLPDGAEAPGLEAWEVHRGEHPVPGALSYAAGRRVVDLARQGLPMVLLLSGGASSLLESPVVDHETHRALVEDLLAAGVPIRTLNAARGLVSGIKAGALAGEVERADGRLTVLYVSDVPDDDPALVGSGPGHARDPEAMEAELGPLPDALRRRVLEAAKEADPPRATGSHTLVLPRRAPVEAAASAAEDTGLAPTRIGLDGPVGEAADRVEAAIAGLPEDGIGLLWGEPHVAVPEDAGRGGRATHLVASLVRTGRDAAVAVAATDGVDGAAKAAGGYARLDTDADPRPSLEAADTATFLDGLPDDVAGTFPEIFTHANSADLGVVVAGEA